jgi:hypothetical protein
VIFWRGQALRINSSRNCSMIAVYGTREPTSETQAHGPRSRVRPRQRKAQRCLQEWILWGTLRNKNLYGDGKHRGWLHPAWAPEQFPQNCGEILKLAPTRWFVSLTFVQAARTRSGNPEVGEFRVS